MRSFMSFLGALPARFRRERVLIVGCGDVGSRAAREMGGGRRVRLIALTSSENRRAALRAKGITPLLGNLDDRASLGRLAGVASRVLYLAPPPNQAGATDDPRARAVVAALMQRSGPVALVYGSTTGVYGDRQGAWVDELTPTLPQSERAARRVDAEVSVHGLGRVKGVRTTVLRIPGIYALDREGGTPQGRLARGTPVLAAREDVYTNHIHADDLARACVWALWRGKPQRNLNVCDDTTMKMGDYFDLAADLFGMPRPPRVSMAEAETRLSPQLLSFMRESRRIRNRRMKEELRLVLRYPTVKEGLRASGSEGLSG
ncbi:MAG: SDR family oxidoreductase [Burkholderiaceae bacterium]